MEKPAIFPGGYSQIGVNRVKLEYLRLIPVRFLSLNFQEESFLEYLLP